MKMVKLCYSIFSFFITSVTDPKGDSELNIP